MNCEEFDKIIHELADYKPMQVTIRDAGVSHVALCAECAAKLANVRAVSSCLLVAASAESEAAPIKIKNNLLIAFANLQQAESRTAPVVDISSRRTPRWWMAAAVGVAAVILLAVTITVWRQMPAPPTSQQHGELTAKLPGSSATPKTVDHKQVVPIPNEKPPMTGKAAASGLRMLKRRTTESGSRRQTQSVARNTGEYMPLTYLSTATAMDSGTIVRVELSRSALASLGFPGSAEGSGELVKAEVILGDDGVARAIRLVE